MEGTGKKIALVSLGCDKNRVDAEHALAALLRRGWRMTDRIEEADAVLINTCAFIDSAKRESVDTVLEFVARKAQNPALKLVVTGCLAERYAAALREEIPEIDILVGVNGYAALPDLLEKGKGECLPEQELSLPAPERELTTLPHYAYLKIAEGCDSFCSYCAIPRIRGRYRSYPLEQLFKEAKDLKEQGVKEVILVAQDTARYGIDRYGAPKLFELIEGLDALGFEWIRLLYVYPDMVDEVFLKQMRTISSLVPYLDIPLQHVNEQILKRMNRRSGAREIGKLFETIERVYPELTVRSTFISGFPGETEENAEELERFIASGKVKYAGFFPYSREEGTPAYSFPEQIKASIKRARVKRLEYVGAQVRDAFHVAQEGKVLPVRYEGIDFQKNLFYGRTPFQTPEVDPICYFKADFPVEVGEVYRVKIERGGRDLMGTALEKYYG